MEVSRFERVAPDGRSLLPFLEVAMNHVKTLKVCALLGVLLLGFVAAQAITPQVDTRYDATLGHFLTGANGMTLYVFTNDTEGQSSCYEQCAVNWPPFTIDREAVAVSPLAIPGAFGTTERTDGTVQVTYNNHPLYYFINDQAPGDTTGQGRGEVWYAANLNPLVQVLHDDEHGGILVGPTGMTLYIFANDDPDVTNCYERCATNWPPLMTSSSIVMSGAGVMAEFELGVTSRDDGGMQITYNGQPLYYFINDHLPGDTSGHNRGEVWFVVTP